MFDDSVPIGDLMQTVLRMVIDTGCPWRSLGLPRGAPMGTVRKRYLSLARRLHPDKVPAELAPTAAEAFRVVESAFQQCSRAL